MQRKIKLGLQTLRRAHVFLDGREFSAALGEVKPQVVALSALVERIEHFATEQDSRNRSARAATDFKRQLETALRVEYLRTISQFSHGLLTDDPALRKSFRAPAGRNVEGLLQAANGFAERAAEHQEHFIAKGLAPDFVERLRSAIAALRQVIITRDLERARRAAATAGMLDGLARGRRLLRLIDTMLAPRLAHQADVLAEWRSITHFMRRSASAATPSDVASSSTATIGSIPITVEGKAA